MNGVDTYQPRVCYCVAPPCAACLCASAYGCGFVNHDSTLWNEGSGASSFLCGTERFGLETGGGLCRLREEAPTETLLDRYTCVPWRSVEQCDGLIPCADESSHLWFLHTEPDDKPQDWLYLVIIGVMFYLLATISRSVLIDSERKCCPLNKTWTADAHCSVV